MAIRPKLLKEGDMMSINELAIAELRRQLRGSELILDFASRGVKYLIRGKGVELGGNNAVELLARYRCTVRADWEGIDSNSIRHTIDRYTGDNIWTVEAYASDPKFAGAVNAVRECFWQYAD